MSVLSPPRPRVNSLTHAFEDRPLRHPDQTPAVMTRRGWWLVVMNFLLPGSAQAAAGSRKLARFGLGATLLMWALLVVGGLSALLAPTALFGFFAGAWIPDWLALLRFLPSLVIQGLLLGYAALWVVLTFDTLRLVKLVRVRGIARPGIALLAVVLMVLSAGSAGWAATVAGTARDTILSVFAQSGPTVPPSDGYYNILLLGADSGEGRDSMRFDSISVVSVNADSGAVTITGMPRDMPNFPFAAGPMQDKYPNGHEGHADSSCGWGSGINQLSTEVEVCQDGDALYPDARGSGSRPAIEATKDAAEGILGIQIPYYVFIDMHGFAALIDALGGVDITAAERLPKGGGPAYEGQPAEEWAIGWIEPGAQHMDGDTAQWYARSRYTTSDFDRMKRQRELQAAILAQFTPATVLTRFNEVAAAGADIVQTDLPQTMLPYFAELAVKSREQPVSTIELTPEGGIDEYDPDYAYIQQLVQQTLHPPTPTPTP